MGWSCKPASAKRLAVAVFLCIFCLSFISGCARNRDAGNQMPAGALPESDPTPGSTPPEAPGDEALECDWLLKVDQTIPVAEDGLTVNYTLVLIAQKTGGTDVYGTYEGAAYIESTLDASSLSNDFLDVTGGFDIRVYANNLRFEIVPYDRETYARYEIGEDGVPDVPLVDYESMALLSPEMTGRGLVDPHVTGENVDAGYTGSSGGTVPVPVKIAVKAGKVHVTIPFLNMDRTFEGLLLGDPAGSGEDYRQAMERIDGLIAESREEPDSDDGGLGGMLGGMLGTVGSGLELPASFPADDFPLAPDANILNVFESEDQKNVRIIYATAMDYEDILDFYAPVIEMTETQVDIDAGRMYMGSSDKYASITLMVMETKDKSDSNMVTLEVRKK